ncbi:MAG: hypothetical protein MZV49_23980 [Rhodopseudomonas palustris]|nr:hypothetical protein [Rhodopseudomonas palustris]
MLNKEGQDDRAVAGVGARSSAALVDLIADEHHLRQDRQGRVRDRLDRGRRRPPRSSKRAALKQVTDTGAIEKAVDDDHRRQSRQGREHGARQADKLLGWFVGQVMKSSGGKANPQAVDDLPHEQTRL